VRGTLTLRAAIWTLPAGVLEAGERLVLHLVDGRTVMVHEITGGTTQRFVTGTFQEEPAARRGDAA
jgi:hypothetical protein